METAATVELISGLFFFMPVFTLAYNLLIIFYHFFGDNLGIAIIMFTLLLKLITLPFSIRQQKSAVQNREFQEKYKAVQAKYKSKKSEKDREKMTKELATLQSEYLPAQLGGCLPMLIQIVFLFQVYFVVINLLQVGPESFNLLNYDFVPEFPAGQQLNLEFLGLNLGQSATQVAGDDFVGRIGQLIPYALLILAAGASQFISGKVMMGFSATAKDKRDAKGADSGEVKTGDKGKNKSSSKALSSNSESRRAKKNKQPAKGKEEKDKPEDLSFSDAMQQASKNMMYFLPLMTMLFVAQFPSGLGLYWTVSSGFVIIQQLIVNWSKVRPQLLKFIK